MKFLTIIFLLNATIAFSSSDTVYVQINLKPEQNLSLFYHDDYLISNIIKIHHDSNKDSTYLKKIFSEQIVEFRYSLIDGDNQKSYFLTAIAHPGDTIKFTLDGLELKAQSGVPIISDYLNVNNGLSLNGPSLKLKKDQIDFESKKYARNIEILDSLQNNKLLPESTIKLWRKAAFNHFIAQQRIIKRADAPTYFDEYLKRSMDVISGEDNINSVSVNHSIYTTVYNVRESKSLTDNLVNFLNVLSDLDINRKYKMGIAYTMILNFPEKNAPFYKEAFDLFLSRIADDQFMATAYGKKLLLNTNNIDKKSIKMETGSRKPANLNDIFMKNKGRYFIVDLWASWCSPCIEAIPLFELMKKKYQGRKIGFESINMDLDSKVADWLRLTKELKITGNNYRVLGGFNKAFAKGYQVSSIPKYLLFDPNGDLVNDDFVSPTDANFERDLQRYLSEL